MRSTNAYESELPVPSRDATLGVDLPSRLGEILARHLTEWYAFCFYGFGLLVVGFLLIPSLLSKEGVKPAVQCRALTAKVVAAAAAVRRQDPMASLSLDSGGRIAARLGGTIPTCPDGGHVQLIPNGTPVQTADGVTTVVSSEYIAGICKKPDGEWCHPEVVLRRVHSLDAQLDRMVRPDSPVNTVIAPPAPTPPVKVEADPADPKPRRKRPRKKPPVRKASGVTQAQRPK
ncbi:MAG: hypothetical protein ACO1SV_12055 [Fimbriimonas sp.]